MDFRALTLRQVPHQPKLFLEFLDHFEKVKSFYAHPPAMAAVKRAARKLDYPSERRAGVGSILRNQNTSLGAGAETFSNLDRLQKGAVAIVSGQQVGLFSGPAYSVYKAVSAVQIAQELTRAGIEAVPIFWMATEDHDLDEVRVSTWFREGKLARFELPENGDAGKPVGRIALGAQVQEMVHEAARILTAAGGEFVAGIFRESYGAQETYGSSFGKLFSRLFAEQGLILLDPLDARLHRIAGDVLRRAVEDRDELNEALLARGKELDKAGFAAQVKVTARNSLIFSMANGTRRPITVSGSKFVCGERSWTKEELV